MNYPKLNKNLLIDAKGLNKSFRKGQFISPLAILYFLINIFIPSLKNITINLKKRYEKFIVINDVSLTLHQGERIGLIGLNGAGKTTLLKILSGVMTPSKGSVKRNGRIVPLLGLGAGFNMEMSGRENIKMFASVLGLSNKEINQVFESIVQFSELEEFLDTPVKRYSKGMKARLGMGVAFHVSADLLIIDEVLAVGDLAFRAKCMSKIKEITDNGASLIFVSHSIARIKATTDRCIVLRKGEIVCDDTTDNAIQFYRENDLKQVGLEEIDIDDEDIEMSSWNSNNHQIFDNEKNNSVELNEIFITGSVSGEDPRYYLDEEILFTIKLKLLDPSKTFYPRVKIFSEDDEFLFSIIWPNGSEGIKKDNSGCFSVTVKMKPEFLNQGNYKVGFGIFSYSPVMKHINLMTDIKFTVKSEYSEPLNPEYTFNLKRAGIVTPNFEWSVGE